MALTMNDLTINPGALNRETLLSDWAWAMEEPMLPVMLTAMGDVFAQGKSGAVYFMDIAAGKIERVAPNGDAFRALLTDAAFVTAKMRPERILRLRKMGLTLGPGQVYGYQQPPALGGSETPDNTEATDVAVHIGMNGQIHRQIKDLPPGTPISGVQIQ